MKLSIIVPSYNQDEYIAYTLKNLAEIKKKAAVVGIFIEILVFDSESNERVQQIIRDYQQEFDFVEIKKDKGQYDAINKGILKCSGDYWTWLNTDDLLDIDGFFKLVDVLTANSSIDYIYGGVTYINEKGETLKTVDTRKLSLDQLVTEEPAIFQPGSFFKKTFVTNSFYTFL